MRSTAYYHLNVKPAQEILWNEQVVFSGITAPRQLAITHKTHCVT